MQRLLKSGNLRMYGYLAALAALVLLWRMGESINQRLAAITIKEVPRVAKRSMNLDAKHFYPAWVKQAVARAPPIEGAPIDPLFRKEDERRAEPKPVPPDHAAIFRQLARIDGIANDGCFINGRFYQVGEELKSLALPLAEGGALIPVVKSVGVGKVTIALGRQKIVMSLRED